MRKNIKNIKKNIVFLALVCAIVFMFSGAVSAADVPSANFTGNDSWGVNNVTVQFNDTSSGSPTGWSWNFGDNGTSNVQNPTHAYTAVGNYTVSLTASNAAGNNTITKNNYISVLNNVTQFANYRGTNIYVANDNGVKYDVQNGVVASNTAGITYISVPDSYFVSFRQDGGGLNPIHISSTNSSYNLINTTNQTGTFYITFSGGQPTMPEAILMLAVNGTISNDFTVHITSNGYTWDMNPPAVGNNFDTNNLAFNSTAENETFDKTDLIYSSYYKLCSSFPYPIYEGQDMSNTNNTFRIMFIDLDVGALNPSNYASLIDNGAIQVNYTFTGLTSVNTAIFNVYGWYAASNHGTGIIMTNSLTGGSTADSGCTVQGVSTPVANFTGNITSGAAPLNVQFTDTSSNSPTSWSWDFGDGSTSTAENPVHTYAVPGNYSVTLTVTGPGGNNTLNQTDYITVFNSTPPTVAATPDQGIYNSSQSVSLSADQSGSTIYYTTDNSDPTDSNNSNRVPYSNPIPLASTTTLNFAAVNTGGVWSVRYTKNYTILQQDVYVSPTGSDRTGNGTSSNPYASIQTGLNNVVASGTLHLAAGTYINPGDGGSGLNITNNVTFVGENPNTTIINDQTWSRGFTVSEGVTFTIANITIANGVSDTAAGIYANYVSSVVNVSNCIFTGGDANNGVGIFSQGTLNVSNSIFSNNNAHSCGAAIYNTGNASLNNCTFINNNVTACGVIYNTGNATLSGCLFTNNSANYAIYNTGSTSNLTVHFSSFVNNTAWPKSIACIYGTVNAQNNWWGSNSPVSQIYGTVNYTNWLYMTVTVDPTTIANGSTGTVTVSFNNIWNGTGVSSIDSANGHIMDGTVVDFSSVLGSFNPVTALTSNGVAISIFTANDTQVRPIIATTDNQIVSTYINGIGSVISVGNVTGAKGSAVNLTATLIDANGTGIFGEAVTFTVNGTSYTATTDANGVATSSYTPRSVGVYSVTASFVGDSSYGDSSNTGYLTVLLGDAYVSPTGNDTTGDGSAVNPYATIQKGLNNLISGGTIHLASGTYTGTGNKNLTITKNVNIVGASQTSTIINAQNSSNIFTINSGLTVTIANLTLANGTTTNGGAISNAGNLNVSSCTFIGNRATNNKGGAIYNVNTGTVNVGNCTFTGNTASNNGGAIFSQGTVNVSNSTFTGNTAYNGGAIFTQYTLSVHFSSFVNNTVTSSGRAIYSNGATVNAQNNWWGTNNSPASQIYGSTVNYSNWLYMTEIVNSTVLANGSAATVTVSFNNVYNGTAVVSIDPASGHIVDGTVVNFSSILGSFSPAIAVTINGVATSVFNAATFSTVTDAIYAATNNQTVFTNVTVVHVPVADFTATPVNGTQPLTVQFTDNSTNNPTSWYWNFGDGNTSTAQNPTHTYTKAGNYTVSLTATNAGGNNTLIENGSINVLADTTAPVIAGVDPANGASNLPVNQTITVTFSEPIQAGAAYDKIKVITPDNKAKTITKTINGSTLTITSPYSYNFGDTYKLVIPVGAVTDLAGNNLTTAYNSNFTIGSVPSVVSVDPVNGASDVSTTKTITVTFNDNVTAGAAYDQIKVITSDGKAKTVTKTLNGNTLTLTAAYNYTPGTYTVYIPKGAVQSLAGNNMTGNYNSTFTVSAGPTVSNVNSSNISTTKTVVVTFNGNISAGANFSKIKVITADGKAKVATVTISGNQLIITAAYNYTPGSYTLSIPANSLVDSNGNAIVENYTTTLTA